MKRFRSPLSILNFQFFPLLLLLLTSCTPNLPFTSKPPPQPSTIILLHGMFGDHRDMQAIQTNLEAQNFRVLAPSLQPSNGSVPIDTLARDLKTYLAERTASDEPLQFIAHSMGGLVALYYLNELGGAPRCRALYTIATPHQGTEVARLHLGPAGRQMIPGSAFLRDLHAQQPPFPVTCFRSSSDLIIIPNDSSTLPFAKNIRLASPNHAAILRNKTLHLELLQAIQNTDQNQ